MKRNKIRKLLLGTMLIASMSLVWGCKDKDDSSNKPAEYKVEVKDALGNPYESGVIVKFLKDGVQVAMQVCDANGVVTRKYDGVEYDVELGFTEGDDRFHYDKTNLKLTADKSELGVVVSALPSGKDTLYLDKEIKVDMVGAGCTYVEVAANERTYFFFAPKQAGKYEISFVGEESTIGNYGAPHFVQENNIAEVVDGKIILSYTASMIGTGNGGTSVTVLGVDSKGTNGILIINRLGDPDQTIEDMPWNEYQPIQAPEKYVLPENAVISEFDLTNKDGYNLVYNTNDGFYHLNSADGPLVMARIAKDKKNVPCFKTILENTGIVKYFYDADGNFVKKETYGSCLLKYISCADEESGLYPLTEDLVYIIKNCGEHRGWWDEKGDGYFFKDENGNNVLNINKEIAWLVMCCYIEVVEE